MKIRNLQSLLVCPQFFENLPSLGSNELLADGPDWHLGSKIVSGVWRSLVTCDTLEIHGLNSCPGGYSDEEDTVGFAKTFPDIPCVSQISGGLSLRLGIHTERFSIPPGSRKGGSNAG